MLPMLKMAVKIRRDDDKEDEEKEDEDEKYSLRGRKVSCPLKGTSRQCEVKQNLILLVFFLLILFSTGILFEHLSVPSSA